MCKSFTQIFGKLTNKLSFSLRINIEKQITSQKGEKPDSFGVLCILRSTIGNAESYSYLVLSELKLPF